jgi:hypothetical protein
MKNWFRKLFRDDCISDLRLIRWQFRHLYRPDFVGKGIGHKIATLRRAYEAGHFQLKAYETPRERTLKA